MTAIKYLYLIRHAKSSWADPGLDDFDRPLNRRGKKNGPVMAQRLAEKKIKPDCIVSSPARRAKKTAIFMAKGTGYRKKDIHYDEGLYLGSLTYHLALIQRLFKEADVLFMVGHNHTITELGEYLTGNSLGNVPTCGVVGIEYSKKNGFTQKPEQGRLLFFDYPKNTGEEEL
ncbi:MAG: SixA phosphatase family protein [Desulforhopalus sp.]